MYQFLKFIYFGITLYTCFRLSFRPSSKVQDCTYSNRHMTNSYCYLLASGNGMELVHLVGFTIKIYYDAQTYECQI